MKTHLSSTSSFCLRSSQSLYIFISFVTRLFESNTLIFRVLRMKFWGGFLVIIGSISFIGFVFASSMSKLLPLSDNLIMQAIQYDRYYCFLAPLTLPVLLVAVYFHWLSMKLFKHA